MLIKVKAVGFGEVLIEQNNICSIRKMNDQLMAGSIISLSNGEEYQVTYPPYEEWEADIYAKKMD